MLQEKFDSARLLIQNHNSVIGEGNPGYVDPIAFEHCIKASGGTTDERLKGFSYEDILKCLPSHPTPDGGFTKPIALAKDLAKIFRGKETNIPDARPVSSKKADKMTFRELVENYLPEDANNSVGKRLKEISKDQPFIVFSSGRTVDVDTTLKLLEEVRQGYEGRDTIDVSGEINEVYVVGDLPDNFVDENPLYPGRPLRPDGTCDQTNRSWAGVPLNIRQFIRIAIDEGELEIVNLDKANDIIDLVMASDPWQKLKIRYRKTALEFKKLQDTQELPSLKLILNTKEAASGKSPFKDGKPVQWGNISTSDHKFLIVKKAYSNWKKGDKNV